MDQLRDHMISANGITAEAFNTNVIAKCDEICRLVFETCKDKLEQKFGCFELFGLDFLLDENLNPQLIEINTNPAIFTDTLVQKDMMPKLVQDTIGMALKFHPIGKTSGDQEVKEWLEQGGVKDL